MADRAGDPAGADDLDVELAAERADDEVRRRRRLREQSERLGEETTFAELVVGHAVGGGVVTVEVRGGARHRGSIVAVGADVVVIRSLADRLILVPLAAMGSIRHHEAAAAEAHSDVDRGSTLHDVLVEWSAERRRVVISSTAGIVSGRLISTGPDVVTVVTDAVERELVQVWLPSVTDVSASS